ncbi:TPR/glycosyl transferase domain protein [Nonlabens ulvanivorans]|uniref:TPR/glycosyl transferase domain protein n=1 Tax=Nonlabens ulvanivorans TaxID=906888 RepID=A0A090WHC5_NONUL|nr:TPR/glycosyl transferase domain protein [Nonlabens ulvanivorans]
MKNPVLIIAYYWPPAGGPGVQRWLKFATYLGRYNFDVTVVIPENADYPVVDESLIAEVPDHISIIKVPINEPSRLASSLSRKRTKIFKKVYYLRMLDLYNAQ